MSELMYYLYIVLFSMILAGLFYFSSVILGFFALIIGFLTLIAGLGIWNMYFELLANFYPQLLIASVFFFIIAVVAGHSRLAILFALCAGVHFGLINDSLKTSRYLTTSSTASEEASLRVMTLDMQASKTEIKKLKERIDEEHPIVIALSKLPEDSLSLIDELKKSDYPYFIQAGEGTPFYVALLSKWPTQNLRVKLASQVIKDEKQTTVPIIALDVCKPENNQRCITVVSLITPNIFKEPAYILYQKILRNVTQIVLDSQKNPVIVMGNLHTTPWTSTFKSFIKTSGLKNSAIGFQWRTTWRFRSPLLGLQLDHILVNRNVDARQWWVGDSVGSDHYPVFADLLVKWQDSK